MPAVHHIEIVLQAQREKERVLEDIQKAHENLNRLQIAIQSAQNRMSVHEASAEAKAIEIKGLEDKVRTSVLPAQEGKRACKAKRDIPRHYLSLSIMQNCLK